MVLLSVVLFFCIDARSEDNGPDKGNAGISQTPLDNSPDKAEDGGRCEAGGKSLDEDGLMDALESKTSQDNFQAALDLLEKCRGIFKDRSSYEKQEARLLALAGKCQAALELTGELLKDGGRDCTVLYARAVALHKANRDPEAIKTLRILESINPGAEETEEARSLILTPLRSSIKGGLSYYHDSDSLEILHYYLEGTYFVNPSTRLQAGEEYNTLHVSRKRSLETLSGGKYAWYEHYWAGAGHRFSPHIDFDLKLGESWARGQAGILSYLPVLNYRANDEFKAIISRNYDYYLESPRTVSLSIKRGANKLEAEWKPALDYVLSGHMEYSTYSDSNKSWEVQAGAQKKLFLVKNISLLAGPVALWTSFSKQLDDGYYNPSLYQRYAMAASAYWSITDNAGISLDFSVGAHKDETMSDFKLSYEANIGADISLDHMGWELSVDAGTSKDTHLNGSYTAYSAEASIIKRF
jgi:hypothetical protein